MQQVALLLACIEYCNKNFVKHNLLFSSIVMPCQSAWQNLYKNEDSRSFTLMTGLSRDVFQKLIDTLSCQPTIISDTMSSCEVISSPYGLLQPLLQILS
jgi:hypothetical protein